jgi:transcriptional regulator with XRE-family HTH domain
MDTTKERIKNLATLRRVGLPKIEAELGFGNGTIVKWDKSSPTVDKLEKVADYFDVSVDYLLGREPSVGSDVVASTPECKGLAEFAEAVKVVQLLPKELIRLNGEVARLSAKVESLGEDNHKLRTVNQELAVLVAHLRNKVKTHDSTDKVEPV